MARKLKIKLPKRVAGVKIPKSVRKGPVGQFLNSGAGQVVIAQALVAAAGALAVSRTDSDSSLGDVVHHPIDATRRAGKQAAQASSDQAARMSYALREAARAFRDAMENGPPDDKWREPGAVGESGAASEPVAKKKQVSRGEPSVPH
ncbi:MAG TPA: hypothetical protein VFO35_07780 [Steroidobacteraceae bacterium]|nr:hypothetical protein [Steroidobacteraceae bacterium]